MIKLNWHLPSNGDNRAWLGFFIKLLFHKGWETEISFNPDKPYWLFDFQVGHSLRGDHWGTKIQVSLLWFEFSTNLYDSRHWNWEEDRPYRTGEEYGQ